MNKKNFFGGVLLLIIGGVVALSGCRSTYKGNTEMNRIYRHALQETETALNNPLPPGSEAEKKAIDNFIQFYKVYSVESIRAGVRGLYATDAYFGDPFHGAQGIDEIEDYFVRMAEPVIECTFDVEDWRQAGGEYFFRWVMYLTVKPARKHPIEVLGFSHVRFNPEGMVVFQQDYWDSSVLFDRLPVVGRFTRLVKQRLDK